MKFLGIKETCLYCRDLQAAKDFYEQKLELPVINYVAQKHLFLRAGRSVLLIFNPDDSRNKQSPPPHYAEGNQHFAFEVSAATYNNYKSAIAQKGIQIIDTLKWKNGLESFYFRDPEGNVLEIVPEGIWD